MRFRWLTSALLVLALVGAPVFTPVQASHNATQQHAEKLVTLLNGVTDNTDGTWTKIRGLPRFSIEITGISDATVVVNVSNSPTQPAAAAHRIEAASVTEDQGVVVVGPWVWVKVRVTGYVGGTIYAHLEAQE